MSLSDEYDQDKTDKEMLRRYGMTEQDECTLEYAREVLENLISNAPFCVSEDVKEVLRAAVQEIAIEIKAEGGTE